jgi:peptide/nickel transport system ATP-binding protein
MIRFRDVSKYYRAGGRIITALEGINLSIEGGEIIAIVGETGSGKTTLGRISVGLERPSKGEVILEVTNLNLVKDRREIWRKAQYVHQDPYSSLDPYLTVWDVLERPLKYLMGVKSREEQKDRIEGVLEEVGMGEEYWGKRIQELSGGERQRVLIARAFIVRPVYVVADEPTTMIDFIHRNEVLGLLTKLRDDFGTSIMIITHDISIARISNHIGVMFAGRVVEYGESKEVLSNPLHPYTQLLLSVIPEKLVESNPVREKLTQRGVFSLQGKGCRYLSRCPIAMKGCEVKEPTLEEVRPKHYVACFAY